jgi:hypothetical protein
MYTVLPVAVIALSHILSPVCQFKLKTALQILTAIRFSLLSFGCFSYLPFFSLFIYPPFLLRQQVFELRYRNC